MPFQAGATITPAVLNRIMGLVQPANDTFTTSVKVLTADLVTFTAIAGHVYEVSWNAQMSGTTNIAATLNARWISGFGPITTSSTSVWSRVAQITAGNDTYHFARTVTGLSGTVTVGITGLTNTGTVTAQQRELLVQDLGL